MVETKVQIPLYSVKRIQKSMSKGGLSMSNKSLVQATMQLPCSVTILTAYADNIQGAMTASSMYVSQVPPLLAVSVSKTFATYQLIEKSKEFAINLIADSQQDLAGKFGSLHGFEVDKFKEFGVKTETASVIKAPLILGCFANIECRVKTSLWDVEGDHAIYIAEVVGFKMDKKLSPMVWLNNKYFRVGNECKL
jgi:flavin reductase (DIM6/NTAB) family NADH-FMN oxidoreductase RutF